MRLTAIIPVLLAGTGLALPAPVKRTSDPAATKEAYLASLATRQSTPINAFLALVVQLFPVNVAVRDISNLITAAEQGLASALRIDTTETDLTAVAAGTANCAGMTIIFARGTTEAGNVGALVGPPFFDAVRKKIGGAATLAVQGVDYKADVPGFLAGGDATGSTAMANHVKQALRLCPNTKIVMSGYSQGGQLVHNAAAQLPASTMAKVSSVVIFGDPKDGQAVAGAAPGRTLVVCHAGDNICDGGDLILLPHLTYAENADDAAAFVVAKAGAIDS